jgi:hypothetical protein
MASLGLLFGRCWNDVGDNYYTRERVFCAGGMNDLRIFEIPYTWILAIAICLFLFAAYRFLDEKRRQNSN